MGKQAPQEAKLDQPVNETTEVTKRYRRKNKKLLNTTDPDAAMACSAAIYGVSCCKYAYVALWKRALGPVMHFEGNMINVSSK